MDAEERKKILAGKSSGAGRSSGRPRGDGKRPATNAKGRPVQPEMTFSESLMSWIKTIVSSLLIVMVINGLLIASFVVPTGSMEDEVMTGDFLFVNKFIFGGSSPQTIPFFNTPLPYFRIPGIREPRKGDVIVFIFPGNRDEIKSPEFQYYLKRCVATAGDTLQVKNKQVFINGVPQPVPPHAKFTHSMGGDGIFPKGSDFSRDNWGPMRIPKKGDVIPLNDSTFLAYSTFIQREGHQIDMTGQLINIDGKPATSYTVGRDYCFGMGDNRDNSLDSRYWGFVPVENVVGTPLFVYWSWDPNTPLSNIGEKLSSIRWDRIFHGVH